MMSESRLSTGVLSVGVTLALALACIWAVGLFDRRVTIAASPVAQAGKTTTTTALNKPERAVSGPYAECAECLKWLRDRSGYPDEIEATWLGRKEWPKSSGSSVHTITVAGRIRGRNTAGARDVQTWEFIFDDGRLRTVQRANHQ